MNRVLMVAYHYPPIRVSSGVQRTLAFSMYLPGFGWNPIILTTHPRAYSVVDDEQMKDIPARVRVERAFALDVRKHLSINGRYLDIMAMPDRWVSWWPGGVWSGLRLIRKCRPKLIWSTYPIATAHLIGLTLHKLTGLPWVADFRDSMTEDDYPRERRRRKIFQWIERKTINACTKAVFTTPGAVRLYRERYPDLPQDKCLLLPNGYNEESFIEAEGRLALDDKPIGRDLSRPLVLLHSGLIYPSERNPNFFFHAIADLKEQQCVDKSRLKIVLRATGHDDQYRPLIKEMGIDDIVCLESGVSYYDALKEMLEADGLLIFQGASCNHQVPAKIYEYFRARRPVLALTDKIGDTAQTLIEAGFSDIAPLDDTKAIKEALMVFLNKLESGVASIADDGIVSKYSRQSAAGILAGWLDSIYTSRVQVRDSLRGR